ncbi:MAG: hypothetical protein CMM00_02000 [Rhodopirellula sp.]|uniref:hypothetical protein n=2 Tax=Rhodopirellula TaxID=265488 RepID=UPI000C3B0725|nr:hypothetical protein [Rhodopirellula sp.]
MGSPATMASIDVEDLRSVYRKIMNPPLFERVVSFLIRFRLDPMARESFRSTLAVLDSMTPIERQHPSFLNESNIDRISRGSGQTTETVRTVIGVLTRPSRRRRE